MVQVAGVFFYSSIQKPYARRKCYKEGSFKQAEPLTTRTPLTGNLKFIDSEFQLTAFPYSWQVKRGGFSSFWSSISNCWDLYVAEALEGGQDQSTPSHRSQDQTQGTWLAPGGQERSWGIFRVPNATFVKENQAILKVIKGSYDGLPHHLRPGE